MPKNLTSAMRAHLDAEKTRLAAIWRITRKDGQQFFFTERCRVRRRQPQGYFHAELRGLS